MARCSHVDSITPAPPSGDGCVECLQIGSQWVHLRRCTMCGHVGCCDSSPHRHATAHFQAEAHAIVQSFEPDEDWYWCYVDEIPIERPGEGVSPSHS